MDPTPSMTGKTPQTQEDIQSNDNRNNNVGDDDDDFGLEHFDNRFDLFGSMNEEWIIRLNRLEDQEEAARAEAAAANNDGSQHPYVTPEHVSLTKTLLYTSRLANLECASWTYKHQQKDTYNLEELIRHVEDEIDHDGDHHANTIRAILDGMADITVEAKNNPQHGQNAQSTKMVSEENSVCDDVDIDAFFQEYPECDRWNYEQPSGDYCPSDSDSDDDSNDEEKENRKTKRQATVKTSAPSDPSPKDVAAMTIDLVEAASEPIPTQPQEETTARAKQPMRASEPCRTKDQHPRQESQSQPRSDANPPVSQVSTSQNLYNTTHQHVGDQQPPPQPQQQRPPSRHGNRSNTPGASQNPYSKPQQSQISQQQQHPPMVSNPYNKRPLSSENNDASSNNDNAWRNHQHQTNPFQTAREVAIAEQNYPHRDPYRQHQQQGGGGYQNPRFPQQQQPYSQQQRHQQHQQQNPFQNPYGNDFQGHQQDYGENNPTNDANTTGGGPYIPESLKRKFQRPKRGLGSSVSQRSTRQPAPPSRPNHSSTTAGGGQTTKRPKDAAAKSDKDNEDELPEELQHLDKELVKKIQNEIQESGDTVTFDDIAGLDDAKATVQEVVCWPMKRPDLFTGLRRAPNGLLLYGPPGTGKTLIGKAIAHESGATFFSISSSSLTSKWIGEGEKLVKTLFAVAAYNEPAVIFLDEIDSLLTQRKATENEASRRIKTEFLVQLDGTGTSGQGRVLIIGATNRPQELDEAARRRFTKRLYIPLPVEADRRVLLEVLLKTNNHVLTKEDIDTLARDTKGFSGADLKSLCTDAAMGPIRQLGSKAMDININDVPPISYKHFKKSLRGTRPSVAPEDLTQYVEWDKTYGTKRYEDEDEEEDD